MKKIIDAARGFRADAWHLRQIRNGGSFDGLERPEMA
jgi:hypothetical protein